MYPFWERDIQEKETSTLSRTSFSKIHKSVGYIRTVLNS